MKIVFNFSKLDITAGSYSHGAVAYQAHQVINNLDGYVDDYVFEKTDSQYYLSAYLGTDSVLTLPEHYKGENYCIKQNAFREYREMVSITIPNSITSIGTRAFIYCTKLISITLPNSIAHIEDQTFYGCSSLTSITIPENVKEIGWGAYGECNALLDVYCLAKSIPTTDPEAFYRWNDEIIDATLHVPASTLETYKSTEPWNKFSKIVALNEEEMSVGKIQKTTKVNCQNGFITLSGLNDKVEVMIYDTAGQKLGTSITTNGVVTFRTNLKNGNAVIIKFGQQSMKVITR